MAPVLEVASARSHVQPLGAASLPGRILKRPGSSSFYPDQLLPLDLPLYRRIALARLALSSAVYFASFRNPDPLYALRQNVSQER